MDAGGVVDSVLECPVCLLEFTEQRMLPCQHTFCLGCLQAVHAKSPGVTLRCPECRTPHPLPDGGLQRLPPSVMVARLQSAAALQLRGAGGEGARGGCLPEQYAGRGAVRSRLDHWPCPSSLQQPEAVAVCPVSGRIVVSDGGPDRQCVLVFRPGGDGLLTYWGTRGSREGQFDSPLGVSVSAHGEIYVCDFHNHRVQRFKELGDFLGCLCAPGDFCPTGVCVTTTGKVFVSNCDASTVLHFNQDNELLNSFGKFGNAPGSLDYPTDICVLGDHIVVNDLGNNRVQILDENGKSIHVIDSSKGLRNPTAVTVDNRGLVLVLDNSDHAVKVYDGEGRPRGKIEVQLEAEFIDMASTQDDGLVLIDRNDSALVFL